MAIIAPIFFLESREAAFTISCMICCSNTASELINTIFMPNTPLHDGGIVIRAERIVTAGCLFPLTENPHINKRLGTRHRAAIGLTEETDAVTVVVSEETGAMSVAVDGKLTQDIDADGLGKMLKNLCSPKPHQTRRNIIRMLRRGTIQ